MALPFVFVTFVIQFPAGLLVYWITTNVWTIVQQAIIRKRLGPLRPAGADDAGGLGCAVQKRDPRQRAEVRRRRRRRLPARRSTPAKVGAAEPKGRPSGPPPASPRKKKKRSGRRR